MPSIFLSYRRADSPDTVKLLYERLKARLPRWDIFYDHENIAPAEKFPERLRSEVSQATVVLVIIGPRWVELLRQRLHETVDHVRAEVELALQSGTNVLPVLINSAELPRAGDLGEFGGLQSLLERNARPIRPDPDFEGDLEVLVDYLKQLGGSEAVGTILADRYTLTAEIGQGGMGVVYLAQQKQPVQRTVAVKLIKPGMDSREVLARFDAERQALAVMDHANVAKVLDGGLTPSGRPFFVMEYVKGVPITQYCDDKKLTPRQRLELFIPVCNAVQHAHQKGIIHRDIKPSNVLVEVSDGKPVPKVIDFGLAKALGHKLTDMTLHTAFETRVGTLEYSSPEQAAGRAFEVDTRTDIYSLGALLYELLTGAPPFTRAELLEAGEDKMRQMIRETEPTKPSKKLSNSGELPVISLKRGTEPARLPRLVRGDLDWIVMKCLEKEPDRRYKTSDQLGAELHRYLADEPVLARPPSAAYRIRKFVRRNKGAVIAAGLVLLALIAGIVGTSIGLVQAEWAREAETKQRELAEASEIKAKQAAEAAIKLAHDNGVLAEQEKIARLDAQQRREQAEKLALRARFDYFYLRGHEDPRMALVGSAKLLRQATTLNDQPLVESICLHLAGWARDLKSLRGIVPIGYVSSRQNLPVFSPDGKTLLQAKWKTARLWDLGTGKPIGNILRHEKEVTDVAYSPDGRRFLTASQDGAGLWDSADSLPVAVLDHQYNDPDKRLRVKFSPDSKLIVTQAADLRLWDAATGKPVGRAIEPGGVDCVFSFSPDSKLVLTATIAHYSTAAKMPLGVRHWDTATGKQVGTELKFPDRVTMAAFSPDAKLLVTSSAAIITLWDIALGKSKTVNLSHHDSVSWAAFSPDAKKLLTGNHYSSLRLWDLGSWPDRSLDLKPEGDLVRAAFSPDSNTILIGYDWPKQKLQLLNAATGEFIGSLQQYGGVLSPDGKMVLTQSDDGNSRLWDATSSRVGEFALDLKNRHGLAFSPGCKRIFAASPLGRPAVFDTAKRVWVELQGLPYPSSFEAFSTDSNTVAMLAAGSVMLWETETGKLIGTLRLEKGFGRLAFIPNGRMLTAFADNNTTALWDVATGKTIGPIFDNKGPYEQLIRTVLAVSQDGETMLRCGSKSAILWNVSTGKPIGVPLIGQEDINSAAFSPDGKYVLTGGRYKARLWDGATGKPIGSPLYHPCNIVAFSTDGKMFLTVDIKTARLWEFATGKQIGRTMGSPETITAVAFAKGKILAGYEGPVFGDRVEKSGCWAWPLRHVAGDPERIALWTTVITGMDLDEHENVQNLDPATWHQRRQRLQELGGPPLLD